MKISATHAENHEESENSIETVQKSESKKSKNSKFQTKDKKKLFGRFQTKKSKSLKNAKSKIYKNHTNLELHYDILLKAPNMTENLLWAPSNTQFERF